MAKVQNFSGISPNLPFTEFDFYDLYRQTFEHSELGRIKKKLPLGEMTENLALEPTYSRNIMKLQIIDNQELFGVHSKSKSF